MSNDSDPVPNKSIAAQCETNTAPANNKNKTIVRKNNLVMEVTWCTTSNLGLVWVTGNVWLCTSWVISLSICNKANDKDARAEDFKCLSQIHRCIREVRKQQINRVYYCFPIFISYITTVKEYYVKIQNLDKEIIFINMEV